MLRKKVAFIIPSLDSGGAEHQTINQINYLVEKGHTNIYLLILSNIHPLLKDLKLSENNIEIIDQSNTTVINKELFKQTTQIALKTSAFIIKHNISDVIAILPMAHLVCRLAKWLNIIKLRKAFKINTYYRDVYYQASPLNTSFKKVFNKFNALLAFLFDDRTLFISQAVYKDISRNFYVQNTLVLPNSLPIRHVNADQGILLLSEKNINIENKYLILIPGRLHPKKNHLLFIEAFHDFVHQNKIPSGEILVIIAGDGTCKQIIKNRIIELNLQKFFCLIGYIDNTILLSLYKCVHLVVIPSKHEGFGNVAIEGLMQQSLMLVSDTGGLSEIITHKENGFLFENDNKSSLVNQLNFIFKNKNKELIDKQVLWKDFISKYTLDAQIKRIIEFCEL